MFKPRLGFYLTEKTHKEPPITEEHDGWIVVYDIDEVLTLSPDEASEKKLLDYVQEQIEYLGLNWTAKELAMTIVIHIAFDEIPERKNISKELMLKKAQEVFENEESELIQKLRNKYDA